MVLLANFAFFCEFKKCFVLFYWQWYKIISFCVSAIVRFIIKEYLYKSNMAHWCLVTVFLFYFIKNKRLWQAEEI